MDLAAEFRSRRWRKLLNLIDGLPSDSEYAEASAQDDELAQRYANDGVPHPSRPRVTEFGPTNRLLADAVDRLGEIIAALHVVAGGKYQAPPILPRPETALERLERKRQDDDFFALVAEIEAARAPLEDGLE